MWQKNRKEFVGRLGSLTAKLLETVFKDRFGNASVLIADTLKALVVEQQGQSPVVQKLSYQQCFELLRDIYSITDLPIVLVLDAFEQLPDPLTSKTILSKILSLIDNWPPLDNEATTVSKWASLCRGEDPCLLAAHNIRSAKRPAMANTAQ